MTSLPLIRPCYSLPWPSHGLGASGLAPSGLPTQSRHLTAPGKPSEAHICCGPSPAAAPHSLPSRKNANTSAWHPHPYPARLSPGDPALQAHQASCDIRSQARISAQNVPENPGHSP